MSHRLNLAYPHWYHCVYSLKQSDRHSDSNSFLSTHTAPIQSLSLKNLQFLTDTQFGFVTTLEKSLTFDLKLAVRLGVYSVICSPEYSCLHPSSVQSHLLTESIPVHTTYQICVQCHLLTTSIPVHKLDQNILTCVQCHLLIKSIPVHKLYQIFYLYSVICSQEYSCSQIVIKLLTCVQCHLLAKSIPVH